MFKTPRAAYAEKQAERTQQEQEAAAQAEQALQAEKERLAALSDKELMVELIMELKRANYKSDSIYAKCDDILDAFHELSTTVKIWS